jgi:bla regulator protein blaR1
MTDLANHLSQSTLFAAFVGFQKDDFTIVAKMPDTAPDCVIDQVQFQNGKAPEVQLMLQTLLADRFHLKVHHETRQLPVYALTLSKKGSKLKPASPSEEFKPPRWQGSASPDGIKMIRLIGQNNSIQEVIDLYSKFTDRPLIDRTGLQGRYDFSVDYEANTEQSGPFSGMVGPSLFKAFEDQTGIKWEATKGPVEILVIDHADRPSSN